MHTRPTGLPSGSGSGPATPAIAAARSAVETAQRALRHRGRDLDAYRAALTQQRRAHVEHRCFLLFTVGDETAVGIGAHAGRIGKFQRKQAGGAGFSDDQLEAFGFEKPEQILGELFDVRHANAPGAG
jgi:hypothetical protein